MFLGERGEERFEHIDDAVDVESGRGRRSHLAPGPGRIVEDLATHHLGDKCSQAPRRARQVSPQLASGIEHLDEAEQLAPGRTGGPRGAAD